MPDLERYLRAAAFAVVAVPTVFFFAATDARADQPVTWTNAVGVSVSGNTLTKTAGTTWGNAGAASVEVIRDGYGYVEFTASGATNRMCGLSNGDSDPTYQDIDFAIHPQGTGGLVVYESGTNRGSFGTYSPTDRLRVEVRHGVVRYLKNGAVFYTSQTPPRYPLRVDTAIYETGATVNDVRVGNMTWANDVGVTMSGSGLTKTGAAGWTSGAVSANAIEASDGFMEFTANETTTSRIAGLGTVDTNQGDTDVDYGILLRGDGGLEVEESGTSRGTFGSYATGDRLRVEVSGGVVRYYQNATLLYTSALPSTYPLRVDTSLNETGATLSDIVLAPIVWTNATGVAASGNTLAKTALDGWNAGASSSRAFDRGDAFVEFTAVEANRRRTVGLKSGGAAQSYADIDFAVDLSDQGAIEVFELGTSRGQFGAYASGDRLRVEIQAGVVRYLRNGALLYTSTTSPTYPLHAEAALYSQGATVSDLQVGDLVWTNVAGALISAGATVKTGAATAWDAGASSTRRINSGYVETTASETNRDRMIGLKDVDSSRSYTDLDFALYLTYIGTVQVYESGTYRGQFGNYAPGDRLRVALESGVVRYYRNGTLLYTSAVVPTPPLRAATTLYATGNTLVNLVYSGAGVTDTPTVSPLGGTYGEPTTVTLTAAAGATIRYTIDGTEPTPSSAIYATPLAISQNLTLKARAWSQGFESATATASYVIVPATAADRPVTWTSAVGVSVSGNTLTKTAGTTWGNAGAASVEVIRDGYGYVEFTASGSTSRMCGLSYGDSDQSYQDIDFAIHPQSTGGLMVYEAGNSRGSFGTYAPTDRLRVEVRHGVVRYLKNGVVFYTSQKSPRYPLRVDTAIYETDGTINDARVGGTTWANDVGVAISGGSLTKTGAAGWTAGAVSANAIEASDGFVEFTATGTTTARIAGLGNVDSNQADTDVDYGILLRGDGGLDVEESGTSRGTFGTYSTGDRLRVEVSGGVVRYYQNGALLYTSAVPPTYPLRVDTSLNETGATLSDVVLSPIVWTNATGVAASGNTLTKTALDGWNAGASSSRTFASRDAFVEFTARETNRRRTVGLKSGGAASSYADIDFAIDLNDQGLLEVFELGTSRGQFGTYANGDRLRVEIHDDVVRYLRNGSLLFASTIAPTYPLHAEATLFSEEATVSDLQVGDLLWTNATGVAVFASAISKTGATAVWDAGATSTRRINSGYVEVTASETNLQRMIGLKDVDTSRSYTDLDYAIYLTHLQTVQIYESGTYVGQYGNYVPGDRFRVALESGNICYYRNGVLLKPCSATSKAPLRAAVALCEPAGTLVNVVYSGVGITDAPVISPGGGTYGESPAVTLTATAGATIRYTTDGTEPTASSLAYTGPLIVNQSLTLKARAWLLGYESATASAAYALVPPTAVPDRPVVFTNVGGVQVAGNSLKKTSPTGTWDAGAASREVIRDGNGYVELTAGETNTSREIGLSNGDSNLDYADIDFALHLNSDGGLYVFESGTNQGWKTTYATGDRLRVEVLNGVVRYRKNGALIYTSAGLPRYPLRVDTALYHSGATLTDVRIGNIAFNNEVGVSLRGSTLTKTAAAGWTAGAASANLLPDGDGYMEFTATETTKARIAGLGNGDANQSDSDVEFGILLRADAVVEVKESGISRGVFGSYAAGDRFRVEVSGGVVRYYQNGTLIYTSAASVAYPLRVDTSLNETGATVTDLVLEPLLWTNPSGVAVRGNALTKTAVDGWNAGATSSRTLDSGDGLVEFTALETTTRRAVGLKVGAAAVLGLADIDYAIDLGATGALEIFELGVSRGPVGAYAHGDRLTVAIEEGVVRYRKNGALLYSSAVPPSYPAHAAAALYTSGATVSDLLVSEVSWIKAVGIDVFARSLRKIGTARAWDSEVVSTRAINSGFVELTATQTNAYRHVGLTHGDTSTEALDVDFALHLVEDSRLCVYESTTLRGCYGNYAPGDRLRVEVTSGVVRYLQNGAVFYTSAVAPALPLRASANIYGPSGSLLDLVMGGASVADTLEPPTISPGTGSYGSVQSVTMGAFPGATIRYTLDGTDPVVGSATYSGPVTVDQSLTLKAKAWRTGFTESAAASAVYTMQVPAPSFAPGGGTYTTPQSVTVTCALPGATIHYTTNGASPTEADPVVASGGSIPVDQAVTLKAAAWMTGWTPSGVASATYTMTVATPTLSPAPGSFVGGIPVTVATATPGALLRYTINGGEPTVNDPVVSSGDAVSVEHSATLKVIGWRTGWTTSATAVGSYSISLGTAAAPTLVPSPATFTAAQTVTLSTTTSGAAIRYTTDGTDPGFQSPLYSGPVPVNRTTVLKARAFAADMTGSAMAGGLYRIDLGTVDPPRLSPGAGQYTTRRLVTVVSETPDALIHYRTDGLDPSESDPIVASGGSILVDRTMHLTARAYKAGLPASAVVAADYTLTGAVALGTSFTVALATDGTVWTWGNNTSGALGDPNLAPGPTVRLTPAPVGISDVVAVAAGADFVLALKGDGTVWGWGRNYIGELGDGTNTNQPSPVRTLDLTDVASITAGDGSGLAVKRDGTLWIWGDGYTPRPAQITSLTGVTSASAGAYHFRLAVKTDGAASGTLWSWGDNQGGKLGDGTGISRPTPVAVAQDVMSSSAGAAEGFAVKQDGTVLSWGTNSNGQLGDGTTSDHYRPTVIPNLTGAVAVAAGSQYGLALKGNGTVVASGYNGYGELGDGTFTWRLTPTPASIANVVAVAAASTGWAGQSHSAAVVSDGTLWTWGRNDLGQLGDGTTTTNAVPKPVPNFFLAWNDADGDGLSAAQEAQLGTGANNPDTNGDGIPDGLAVKLGLSATNTDIDGDGVSNSAERAAGTDPFRADSDGDGVPDGVDCAPLDPTRTTCGADPNDHTPPVITLDAPADAVPLG